MPDGLVAARALGIHLERSGAQPFRGIRFCGGGEAVEALFPNGYGLGIRRTALHEILVEHAAAAGARLAWGTRVTGIGEEGVFADDRLVRARWIVGADGGHSNVRRWAGLDACRRDRRRYGFRRHYSLAPWSEYMEVHWGDRCQLYITPVGAGEICVVLISADPRLRLDDALPQFPEVASRLRQAGGVTAERGGVTASRSLQSVASGPVALVGDASGSVDAVTGEGLCLLFQQAASLASSFETGGLELYQAEHRRIGRRPQLMADFMLLLDGRRRLRRRALRAFSAKPRLFARLLAMHVGELTTLDFFTNSVALGWNMLTL